MITGVGCGPRRNPATSIDQRASPSNSTGFFSWLIPCHRGFRNAGSRITMRVMNRFLLSWCAVWALSSFSPACGDEAAEKLILATYKLANESSTASGFAVHRVENGRLRHFIVTANHVLEQMTGDSCMLVLRTLETNGVYRRNEIELTIRSWWTPTLEGR